MVKPAIKVFFAGILLLLPLLFFWDYLRPKQFNGYFKCNLCGHSFKAGVSEDRKPPFICPKCKQKSAYLAGEFFCPRCEKDHSLALEIPPWEEKEKGEALSALYAEGLAYSLKSGKTKCPICGKSLELKESLAKEALAGKRRLENEEAN